MNIGVIGCGFRISLMIQELLKLDPTCRIAAVADPDRENVSQRLAEIGVAEPKYYTEADEMLDREQLDGVMIGTRCSLHTEMAIKVIGRGIPLFLEKPVATTLEDWYRLREASLAETPVVVSFPLRASKIVRAVREILDSGKIGAVDHVQAVNNVTYGGVYFHDWYRDEQETGGLFLQKATHDMDYLQSLIGAAPTSVCAMVSKQVFKGSKPAGLRCSKCEERDCPERVVGGRGDFCCFAADTGNEDSGSALVQYATGMHLSYSQNFFCRREACARGARLIGYKGTVEFDFYTQKIQVIHHHSPVVETHQLDVKERHFGGDLELARSFLNVMRGGPSISTLKDGLTSSLICLKAREAARTHTYQFMEGV
ncbi:Gfo/Idh/MocA family oxidoreductase [Paenibacillus oryzisoli]|uniref:Gfo/Idh/MocA family protein n=1 Tax=Paenibacillus oryzisoli TaxID=1850517 RepID=UPI003D26F253